METDDKRARADEVQPGQTIETASATTSPDNTASGNGAYVLVATVLLALLLLSSSVASCAGRLAEEYLLYSDGCPEERLLVPGDGYDGVPGYGLDDGDGDGYDGVPGYGLGDGDGYGLGDGDGYGLGDAPADGLGAGLPGATGGLSA